MRLVYLKGPGSRTANEGPVRIQYKCLVPIYETDISKTDLYVLSPSSYTNIFVRDGIFLGLVCLFCCREIRGPILGIYKLLTDDT